LRFWKGRERFAGRQFFSRVSGGGANKFCYHLHRLHILSAIAGFFSAKKSIVMEMSYLFTVNLKHVIYEKIPY
jgi:hypothetical protein